MKHAQSSNPTTTTSQSDAPRLNDLLVAIRKITQRDTKSFTKQLLVFSIFILAGLGILGYSQHPEWFQRLNSKAESNTALIKLQPTQVNALPSTTLQLWTTTSAPTGFVAVEIDFMPSVIQLTGDATITNTGLWRIIKRTPYSEANSMGKIVLVLGLDPTHKTNAPQGSIQLATLNFSAVTPALIATTNITISGSASSVVGMDTAFMSVTTTGTAVSLHIPGDISGDTGTPNGVVDLYDYNAIVEIYGQTGTPGWIPADMTGETTPPDGVVDLYDLNIVVENYGRTQ